MNRRTVIRNLLIIAGGTVVIPSCRTNQEEVSIPLKHLKLKGADEKLMAEMGETILPASSIPGAKDTYTQLYALKMLDDCYEKEDQEKFVSGLKEVDKMSKQRFDKSFVAASPAQRSQVVAELEERMKKDAKEDVDSFYATMKNLTVRGYLTSKYVMTHVLKYEMVPGRYHPCVPVKITVNKI